jgi:AsmA protein
MRTGKIGALVLGGLVAVLVLGILWVSLLINPNEYKPRVVAAVRQATGRELRLDGDIKLAFFPWLAFEFGPASLGNPPGFSAQPFLSLERASLRLRLLPLLSRRIEFGAVEIDGLDVRLAKNGAGVGNWQGFGHDADAATGAGSAPPSNAITAVKLVAARVRYEDLRLENIEVETGAFADYGVVPVTLHAQASLDGKGTATVDARFDVGLDARTGGLTVAALNANGQVSLSGNPRPVRMSLMSPRIDLNLAARTFAAPELALDVAGAHLRIAMTGTAVGDVPELSGDLTLAPLQIRELLPRLGVGPLRSRDPKAWSMLDVSSRFRFGEHAVSFDGLKATLDDTHLSGSIGLTNLATPALAFDLAADHIDLDRYLAPATQVSQQTEPPDAPTPAAPAPRAPLDANGMLRVASLHLGLMQLGNVQATLAAHDRILHLFPVSARIDGGEYSGDITLDRREPVPTLELEEHLTGIDVGRLLGNRPGPGDSSRPLRLSGRGSLSLRATGRGVGTDSILKTLQGHFDASIADGALEGVDLGYEFGRAHAFMNHDGASAASDTHRTAFNVCDVSADIADGVATTHDLSIESVVLKISGEGSVTLATEGLDLELLADTKRSLGGVSIRIPLKLTGTIADPTVRADVTALTHGELRDKLRRLFGKP